MSDTTDKSALPQHVGLILDGNRRWARSQGLPTYDGHAKGYGLLKSIGRYLIDKGVSYVSVYVFSTENWKRASDEVKYLMDLVLKVATEDMQELHDNNIRLRFLGVKDGLSDEIIAAMKDSETKTANNTAGTLALCFNYGGKVEIVEAVKSALQDGVKPENLTEEDVASHLWAPEVPDVDLVIRTSGEQRLSNFMLWRAAYSELYFFEKHWPAITNQDIDVALDWYAGRDRRFGGDAKPKA